MIAAQAWVMLAIIAINNVTHQKYIAILVSVQSAQSSPEGSNRMAIKVVCGNTTIENTIKIISSPPVLTAA
jgi:hypothetical protein